MGVLTKQKRLFETKGFTEQLQEIIAKIGKDRQVRLLLLPSLIHDLSITHLFLISISYFQFYFRKS